MRTSSFRIPNHLFLPFFFPPPEADDLKGPLEEPDLGNTLPFLQLPKTSPWSLPDFPWTTTFFLRTDHRQSKVRIISLASACAFLSCFLGVISPFLP